MGRLTACPRCGHEVAVDAAACPGCGQPLRTWKELFSDAWRNGIRHSWKAAAAFPVMYLLAVFTIRPPHMLAPLLPQLAPWLALLAIQGFVAAATLVSAVALLRGIGRHGRRAGVWVWSEYAVAATIIAGGFWIYTSIR